MKPFPRFCAAFIFLLSVHFCKGQTPTDAILMNKGQICVAVIYAHESWDEYWEGTLLRTNGNIGTLTRQTIMPMATLGLWDRINIIAAVPWMKTDASAGYIKGVSGFQDWGFWIKGKALDIDAGPGHFTTHLTAGLSGPLSDYLADYGPYSLGLGCLDFSLNGVLQYRLEKGLYLRGNAGYHLRGNSSIERDYYYTTHGVYADEVDMPDAITWAATLGSWFFNHTLKVEASYNGLNSLDGFDIRRQDAGFPSNKMIYTGIGGGVQYYVPGIKGFGFLASFNQTLTGRNVGKSTMYSAGLTYFFPVWKVNQTESISE
jgi:hypothetical protein